MQKNATTDTQGLSVPVMLDAGIPPSLADWISNRSSSPSGRRYSERMRRFVDYYIAHPDDDRMRKAWRTLDRTAKSADSLISLFMLLPDKPDTQPFTGLYGRRQAYPSVEKERYTELAACANELRHFLRPMGRPYSDFLADLSASNGRQQQLATEVQGVWSALFHGLHTLHTALEAVDPTAKYLTKHWDSPSGAIATYTYLVARLNRWLTAPRHAALARIATINCPAHPITANAVQKAWTPTQPNDP